MSPVGNVFGQRTHTLAVWTASHYSGLFNAYLTFHMHALD